MTAEPAPVSARERTPFGDFQLRRSHLKTGGCPYPPGSPEAARWASVRHGTGSSIPLRYTTPEQDHAAALTLAELALDRGLEVDGLRELLDIVGLAAAS